MKFEIERLRDAGELEAAGRLVESALERWPGDSWFQMLRVCDRRDRGFTHEARAELSRLRLRDIRDPDLLVALAACAHTLGDVAALRDFLLACGRSLEEDHSPKALSSYPEFLHLGGCLLWADKKWEKGLDAMRTAVQLRPENPALTDVLAQCLIELGRDDEALTVLTQARERHPLAAFSDAVEEFLSSHDRG